MKVRLAIWFALNWTELEGFVDELWQGFDEFWICLEVRTLLQLILFFIVCSVFAVCFYIVLCPDATYTWDGAQCKWGQSENMKELTTVSFQVQARLLHNPPWWLGGGRGNTCSSPESGSRVKACVFQATVLWQHRLWEGALLSDLELDCYLTHIGMCSYFKHLCFFCGRHQFGCRNG